MIVSYIVLNIYLLIQKRVRTFKNDLFVDELKPFLKGSYSNVAIATISASHSILLSSLLIGGLLQRDSRQDTFTFREKKKKAKSRQSGTYKTTRRKEESENFHGKCQKQKWEYCGTILDRPRMADRTSLTKTSSLALSTWLRWSDTTVQRVFGITSKRVRYFLFSFFFVFVFFFLFCRSVSVCDRWCTSVQVNLLKNRRYRLNFQLSTSN